MDGSVLTSVEVAKPTFDPATLDEADFEDMNPLHFVDITTTDDYIYALYWGHTSRQHQAHDAKSTIYKVDWDGNIVARYPVNSVLKGIAAYNDNILIGWTGNNFVKIPAGRDAIYRVRIEKRVIFCVRIEKDNICVRINNGNVYLRTRCIASLRLRCRSRVLGACGINRLQC